MSCIIHCTDDDSDLVSLQDVESWETLYNAARIRQHSLLLEKAECTEEGKVPEGIQYHRKCRSRFTLKRDLKSIESKLSNTMPSQKSNDNESKTCTTTRTSHRETNVSKVCEKICIFCKKQNKYMKGMRTREPLVQCVDLRADASIRKAATCKLDHNILVLLGRDLVAAEGHYHKSCYKHYVYIKEDCTADDRDQDMACIQNESFEDAAQKSFENVALYIREELIPNPKIVPFSDIISRFNESMHKLGFNEDRQSAKKNLRRRLENEFEGKLKFALDEQRRLVTYPDTLSTQELVKQVLSLQNELKSTKNRNTSEKIAQVAMELRSCIKNPEVDQSWPPDTEVSVIPKTVEEFLKCLLTGDQASDPKDQDSQKVQRLVSSFGSDLVFAITGGRIKPPKHVLLSYAVKTLTGNIELIQTLNRLGHCISRHQYEEIDTSLCLQKLDMMQSNNAVLISAHPNVPTTVAWDNIDRLEETLSGGGTSHRVNGIAIQPQVEGPMPQNSKQGASKTKKRSISVDIPELPLYNSGQRIGPPKTETKPVETESEVIQARKKNHIWFLSRELVTDDQFVSSWTGFNIQVRNDIAVAQDTITYLPTINAPATQMSTVKEILEQTLHIKESLHLKHIVCVFDQALYAKATEIVWKNEKYKPIILRLGAFHTMCNLLAIIGKRFQNAGLVDLCVETGIVAEGSIAGVMEGRRYNRAVRVHKIVYEALMRLAWTSFKQWFEKNHSCELARLEDMTKAIKTFHDDMCQEAFQRLLVDENCTIVLDLFQEYLTFLREISGLAAFWLSYIDLVEVLLNLIRASREGNWLLHLAAVEEMIPWCFAYDKINYARFLPYYYASMTNLQSDHPEIFTFFMSGGFSVQIGQHNPFGRIPVDQATEETVNKDTQTPGGTKGFSLKTGAVSKYYLTSEYRSRYLRQMRQMVGQNDSAMTHKDLQMSRIKKDETDVKLVFQLLETGWLNPFNPDNKELASLSTGVAAPADIARDLTDAYTVGKEAYMSFKKERIEAQTHFFDKMSKKRLKTFTDIGKRISSKSNTKEVVLKTDRKLFGQMILVAETRKLHITEVLSHPLGPIPWSLANSDGSLRKTNKANLARALEKIANSAESIPQPSACIIDGMALVQRAQGNDKTFSELSDTLLSQIICEGADSQRIDVVFDIYNAMSIKNAERERRGSDKGIHFKSISPGHRIQQWRKLLSSAENKTNLIRFLVEEWKSAASRKKLKERTLFVTCDQTCFKITAEDCVEVRELKSTQEEADTRLLLHAKHASDAGLKSVVITADDTDVMVICLGFSSKIKCPMFQKCGTKNRTKFNDIRKLSTALGEKVCEALIGMHAFTGCDTVSAFCGKGKAMMLKLVRSNLEIQEVFRELGCSWTLTKDLFLRLQKITCQLYMASTQTTEVNRLRYQLFCARRGEVDSSQLPPCEDCLFMHSLRANYQACIWRRCLQVNISPPHPKDYGWKVDDDGCLSIDWMRGPPAPDAVLDLLSCKCVRSCKLSSCACLNNGLKCTDMCRLQNCSNQEVKGIDQATEHDILETLDDSDVDVDSEIED